MTKCRIWLPDEYRARCLPKLVDAWLVDGKVLIPGLAWWDAADESRREEIKQYCVGVNDYYGLEELPDVTEEEARELDRRNPLWFCVSEFTPVTIIDGISYYVPFVYADCLGVCPTYSSEFEGGYHDFLPFESNGKWGHVEDYTGNIIIHPAWDFVGSFDFEEPFTSEYALVGRRCGIGSGKSCDIRCIMDDDPDMDNKPRLRLQVRNIETGEIKQTIQTRKSGKTFCGDVCDAKFGYIDRKGNLLQPLTADGYYASKHCFHAFYDDVDLNMISQKNGKVHVLDRQNRIICEIELIDPESKEIIETQISKNWIFTQCNE